MLMEKSFVIKDHLDNSLLKCIINEIVSLDFLEKSKKDKMDFLEGLDRCIYNLSGMPVAHFVEENENLGIDDLNIGNIDNYDFGLKLLYTYFFHKRQQYQQYCVLNNDKGDYSKEEFEAIKYNYTYTPISHVRLQVPRSDGFNKYMYNYNKSDAYMYASEQISAIVNSIDYTFLFSRYTPIEITKFVFLMRNTLKSQQKIIKRIQKLVTSKRWQKNFSMIVDDYENKLESENIFIEDLNNELKNKNHIIARELSLCCFNEYVWEKLSLYGKVAVIEYFNEFLSDTLGVNLKNINYDSFKLIDMCDGVASLGDIETISSKEIFMALIYSYAYSVYLAKINELKEKDVRNIIENIEECNDDYTQIKDKRIVKDISLIAVDIQKYLYEYIKYNPVLGIYNIDFYGKKKDFIYDMYKEIANKGGRK